MHRPLHRLIGVLFLTAACSAAIAPSSGGPQQAPTVVNVRNNHWENVRIYLLQGDVPIKLGVVGAMRSQTFPIPNAYLGSGLALRLAMETFGSRERHASESVNVAPGSRIEWVVEPRMKNSSVVVR